MEDKLKFLLKEMYYFIIYTLPRNNEYGHYLGDWKFTRKKLRGGDLQFVIYRKKSEINFLYSEISDNKLEMYVNLHKVNDAPLFQAIISYFKYPHNGKELKNTFYFKDLNNFKEFIYSYLLKEGGV